MKLIGAASNICMATLVLVDILVYSVPFFKITPNMEERA